MDELNEQIQASPEAQPSPPTGETEAKPVAFESRLDLGPSLEKINKLMSECKKIIIGQESMMELMVIALLSDGHILLEGVPGVAKTLMAKVLAKSVKSGFSRIQFTPDLLPSDVIGTSVYNQNSGEFTFKKGPIFSNVILADEINRAPAKTQSAMFEVMEERQISFDGECYEMSPPFIVIATQNPIEQEGTYRLPEAQLDRFLMKIEVGYPTKEEEFNILDKFRKDIGKPDLSVIKSVISRKDLKELKNMVKEIHIENQMLRYIAEIVSETRNHAKLYLGGSPRASISLMKASKAAALMAGRDFVTPDDIKYLTPHILHHRTILTPEAEMEGYTTKKVIQDIVRTLEIPR